MKKHQNITKKIIDFKGMLIEQRENLLSQKVKKYKENYLILHNREPKEIEIKKFRKEVVLKIGIYLYIPLIIVLFIIWQSIKDGGIAL